MYGVEYLRPGVLGATYSFAIVIKSGGAGVSLHWSTLSTHQSIFHQYRTVSPTTVGHLSHAFAVRVYNKNFSYSTIFVMIKGNKKNLPTGSGAQCPRAHHHRRRRCCR